MNDISKSANGLAAVAEPVNPVRRKKMRAVTLSINNRCPLRCRHCSVGFSDEFKGTDNRLSIEEMADIIEAIDPRVYDMVAFAGGEPSLEPALLRAGIIACKARGLLAAIVTAPVWSTSPEAAERFLASVPGLDIVCLSYDRYHLDFLKVSHYENAVRTSSAQGLTVGINMCYTGEAEKKELLDKIAAVSHLTGINTMRTVPVGNAAKLENNVVMDQIRVETVADLDRIPRGCILGMSYLDESHSVSGCCWSQYAPRSPFMVAKQPGGLAATFAELEQGERFQAFRARGFLDGLNSKGQESLAKMVKGRSFANECHLCLTAMQEGSVEIWDEFIPRTERQKVVSNQNQT